MSKKIVSRTAAKTGRIVTIGEQRDIAVGGAGVGGLETTFSNRIGTPQGHTQQGTIVSIIGAKAEDAANTDWFRLKARYTGTGTDCTDQSEWCRAFNVSATQQISAATLGRFFDLHVLVLPAIIVALLLGHFWMIRRHGISGRL